MTIPRAEAQQGLTALATAYAEARTYREQAQRRLAALQETEDRAAVALFDAMERQDLRSITHELGVFGLNDLAWAKIEDRDAAVAWAEANEPELLTLNNQRLSVAVREFIKGERPEMPPGVGFTASRKIRWSSRKGGPSDG